MENQRVALQQELRSLANQIDALEKAVAVKPDYGMGKGDPAVTQWELDRALLRRLKTKQSKLNDALARMESGNYGICEHCGARINPERLAVLPDTTVCMACAQKGLRPRGL